MDYEKHLRSRLLRKEKILKEGGEQALSHSQEDLDRIKRSLKRLSTHGYGLCIDCGDPIVADRLALIPEAERCAKCQDQYEQKLN